jgi:hypothetical protein
MLSHTQGEQLQTKSAAGQLFGTLKLFLYYAALRGMPLCLSVFDVIGLSYAFQCQP